jgi:hypothetical protein
MFLPSNYYHLRPLILAQPSIFCSYRNDYGLLVLRVTFSVFLLFHRVYPLVVQSTYRKRVLPEKNVPQSDVHSQYLQPVV